MIGDNETNFPHKLLITNRQVSNLGQSFANNSSTDVKLSKPHLSKMIQSGGFLSRLLGPLLKTGLPLIKSVIKPLVKSVLIPLGLTAAASATDPGIHLKILGSGNRHSSSASHTTLIKSNDEIDGIIKIIKSLEDSGLLLEEVTKAVQNEVKEQKKGFFSMLISTLGASLLGNLLTRKGIYGVGKGNGINRAGEGVLRAGYGHPSSSALHRNKIDF